MARETTGPGHWRISARNLDFFRTRVYGGRVLSAEEIESLRKTKEEITEEKEK